MNDPARPKRIAVLIPCYNEAKTIGEVVTNFKAALPEAVIYVYDNNSTDGTAQRAIEAGAVVRQEPRQGKGNVVRRMFREIDADCYLMADGDGTYPAQAAAEMVREQTSASQPRQQTRAQSHQPPLERGHTRHHDWLPSFQP